MMDEMQIARLTEHGVDYRDGVDRFGGNAALFEKFFMRYLTDDHCDQLVAVVEQGDCEAGFRIAHSYKGVVGNLSFVRLFSAVDAVTEALRQNDIDRARALIPPVIQAHVEVVDILGELR